MGDVINLDDHRPVLLLAISRDGSVELKVDPARLATAQAGLEHALKMVDLQLGAKD